MFESIYSTTDGVKITAYYRKNWEGYLMKPHRHPSMEIMYVVNGSTGMMADNDEFTMRSGSLILIDAGQTHAIRMQPDQRCRMLNLEFGTDETEKSGLRKSAQVVSPQLNRFLQTPKPYIVLEHAQGLYHALQDVIFERDRADGDEVYQLSFWGLMAKIARAYEQGRKEQSSREGYVDRATDYMYRHYDEKVAVSDIAACVCLSENYFQRLFKSVSGQTPMECLLDIRLEKAVTLLQSTDIVLGEIPDYIGIRSKQYFYQSFKKKYAMTPKAFRERYKDVRIADR